MTDLDPQIRDAFEAISLDPATRDAMLAQAKPERSRWSGWAIGLAIAATLLVVATPAMVSMDTVRAAFGLPANPVATPDTTLFDLHEFDGFIQVGDHVEVVTLVDRASGVRELGFATVTARTGGQVTLEGTEHDIQSIIDNQRPPLTRLLKVHGAMREMAILPDPIGTPNLRWATRTGRVAISITIDNTTNTLAPEAQVTFERFGVVGLLVSTGQTVALLQAASQGVTNLAAVEPSMRVVALDVPDRDLNHGIQHSAGLYLVGNGTAIDLGSHRMQSSGDGAHLWVPQELAERLVQTNSMVPRLASAHFDDEPTVTVAVHAVCAGMKQVVVKAEGRVVAQGTCYDIQNAAMVTVPVEMVPALLMLDDGSLVLEPR